MTDPTPQTTGAEDHEIMRLHIVDGLTMAEAVARVTPDPKRDAVARVLFMWHYIKRDDASPEWAERYWRLCSVAPHKGDCPHAEYKGPITCDRCVCDEFREEANAVMEVIANG